MTTFYATSADVAAGRQLMTIVYVFVSLFVACAVLSRLDAQHVDALSRFKQTFTDLCATAP